MAWIELCKLQAEQASVSLTQGISIAAVLVAFLGIFAAQYTQILLQKRNRDNKLVDEKKDRIHDYFQLTERVSELALVKVNTILERVEAEYQPDIHNTNPVDLKFLPLNDSLELSIIGHMYVKELLDPAIAFGRALKEIQNYLNDNKNNKRKLLNISSTDLVKNLENARNNCVFAALDASEKL